MLTHVPRLRAIASRLRDPLWLPLLSACCAVLAFEAASLMSGHAVLVAARNLPAGSSLTRAVVRTVRWAGPMPSPVLNRAEGRLLVPLAAGMPILRSAVSAHAASPATARQVVGVPASSLLSAPPLAVGEIVSVYIAQTGLPPERLVPTGSVASGTAGDIALSVPSKELRALLTGIAAGHLIITASPADAE